MATKTKKKELKIKMISGMAKADNHQIKILAALGLRRSKAEVEHDNSPIIQGMLRKVAHMVEISENK